MRFLSLSLTRAFAGFAALALSAAAALPSMAADQEVTVTVGNSNPPIDIVLSKGQSEMNVSGFRNSLINKIRSDGFDTSGIEVQQIDSRSQSVSNSFSWSSWRSSSVNNSYGFTNNGTSFSMIGNGRLSGSGADFVALPKTDNTQEFEFSYSLSFGDSFNSAGMLYNVQQSSDYGGQYISGNILQMGKPGRRSSGIGTFKYYKNTNRQAFNANITQNINISTSGAVQIKNKPNVLEVWQNGRMVGSTPVTNRQGSGFGFYSDHYSHNCSRLGQFQMGNLKLVETNEKSMIQVMQSPTWRENSNRLLVNVNDAPEPDFATPEKLSQIATRYMNNNVHYFAWGSPSNRALNDKLISLIDNNGDQITNSSASSTEYNNSINATAKYIEDNFLEKATADSDYVVIDDPITISVNPDSARQNTVDDEWPQGKWRLEQDPNHFYMGNGLYSKSGIYLNDLPASVDKVGKYSIYYKSEKIKELYVHRRPNTVLDYRYCSKANGVACTFDGTVFQPGQIQITSSSYDPDTDPSTWTQTNFGAGIVEEKWQWKYADSADWSTAPLPTIKTDTTKDIIVSLSVKDANGAWSIPAVKSITDSNSTPPVADFSYQSSTIPVDGILNINNSSYSPNGAPINRYSWTLQKAGATSGSWIDISTFTTNNTDTAPLKKQFAYSESGSYRYTLSVRNIAGAESSPYTVPFTVDPNISKPQIVDRDTTITKDLYTPGVLDIGDVIEYKVVFKNVSSRDWVNTYVVDTNNVTYTCSGPDTLPVAAPHTDVTCVGSLTATKDNLVGTSLDNKMIIKYRSSVGGPEQSYELDPVTSATQEFVVNVVEASSGFSVSDNEIANGKVDFGESVVKRIQIRNDGSSSVVLTSITDNYSLSYQCDRSMLMPAESTSCSMTHVPTVDLVTGDPLSYRPVLRFAPDGDIAHTMDLSPLDIETVKPVSSLSVEIVPPAHIIGGTDNSYQYKLTNNGTVVERGLDATNSTNTAITCPISELTPGSSVMCSAQVPVPRR